MLGGVPYRGQKMEAHSQDGDIYQRQGCWKRPNWYSSCETSSSQFGKTSEVALLSWKSNLPTWGQRLWVSGGTLPPNKRSGLPPDPLLAQGKGSGHLLSPPPESNNTSLLATPPRSWLVQLVWVAPTHPWAAEAWSGLGCSQHGQSLGAPTDPGWPSLSQWAWALGICLNY